MAGGRAVDTVLRRSDDPVVLIGAEPHAPYHRPEISKGYLHGTVGLADIGLHPRGHYASTDRVRHRASVPAVGIDTDAREVLLADGSAEPYAKLLIATGGRPTRLGCPGGNLSGIRYLRTVEDADAIRTAFTRRPRIVAVGSGLVGLEVAAAARSAGLEVDVVDAAERLLPALGPAIGEAVRAIHENAGVRFRFGATVERFEGTDAVSAVVLDDGARIPAELVIVGIGITPDTAWLPTDLRGEQRGAIATDALGRMAVADVHAAGDVCRWEHPHFGPLTTEHEAVAQNQGMHVAMAMLGRDRPFRQIPFAWSDQYEHSLQVVGVASAPLTDDIVTFPAGDGTVSLYLHDGAVTGAATVDANDSAKRLTKRMHAGLPVPMSSELTDDLSA